MNSPQQSLQSYSLSQWTRKSPQAHACRRFVHFEKSHLSKVERKTRTWQSNRCICTRCHLYLNTMKWRLKSNVPLSRVKIDTGANRLASVALIVASEAFAHGRLNAAPVSDSETAFALQLVMAAMRLQGGSGSTDAQLGRRRLQLWWLRRPRLVTMRLRCCSILMLL